MCVIQPCVHSGLPNYRPGQAPTEKIRVVVPATGHVQVPHHQGAAAAHTGHGDDDQENARAVRDGAAHRVHHVAVLPEQQRVRVRQPDGRGPDRPGRAGGRIRAAHSRHVRRLLVVRATGGGRVPAEHWLQGLLQEPDGRHEGRVQEAAMIDAKTVTRALVAHACSVQSSAVVLYFKTVGPKPLPHPFRSHVCFSFSNAPRPRSLRVRFLMGLAAGVMHWQCTGD